MMRALFVATLLCACSATPGKPVETPKPVAAPSPIDAAIAAPDRDAEDKALDAGRKPAEVLAFFGVAPGMRIGELFSGRGYTTELLARVVGEKGSVFGQNSKVILEKFAEAPWSARLKKPVMKPVVRVDREIDDPFPPEAKNLDVVIFILNYHDVVWMGADRAKMNKTIFDALKPGGVYGIVDHSAKDGTGVADVQTLHRIEEKVVREEVTAAGFKLAGESPLLRNPSDPRDWNASPMKAEGKRGTSDRFVLKFVKP